MIRYFICENCHCSYEADDAGNTNCPYCHSDNVRPARKPSGALKYIGMAAVFAAFCAGGYFMPALWEEPDDTFKSIINPIENQTVQTVTGGSGGMVVVPEVDRTDQIPVITEISVPVLKGESYSFNVQASTPGGDNISIYLTSEFGTDPLYTAKDGRFTGVAPVEGGVYKVVAENVKTGDKVEKMVSGCLPIQKIEKLTVDKMQAAFNTGSIPGKDFIYKFVSSPKINVIGMEEGEASVTNVGEIFNRIGFGVWNSVEVSDPVYAADNRVKAFTIKVTY